MEALVLLIIQWNTSIIVFTLLVSSFFWPRKKWISVLLTFVIVIRNYLPLLDLEKRRMKDSVGTNIWYLMQHNFSLCILTLFMNFWYKSKIFIVMFNIFNLGFIIYGSERILCPDEPQ